MKRPATKLFQRVRCNVTSYNRKKDHFIKVILFATVIFKRIHVIHVAYCGRRLLE